MRENEFIDGQGHKTDGFSKNIFTSGSHNRHERYSEEDVEYVHIDRFQYVADKLSRVERLIESGDYRNPNTYKFRFALGDTVWSIGNSRAPRYKECLSCEKGKIGLKDGSKIDCPNCKGSSLISEGYFYKWRVERPLTVGQLRLEFSSDKLDERYMCQETGVGSGTCHSVDTLFATKEEAVHKVNTLNITLTEYLCSDCLTQKTGMHDNQIMGRRHHTEWMDCIQHGHRKHYRFLDGKLDESEKK